MNAIDITFDHIGLYAQDLPAMEAFYTRVLGFTVTDRGYLQGEQGPRELLFLSRNPDQHHQIVLISGRPSDLPFNVVNQVSLKARDLSTLRVIHDRVVRHGCRDITPTTHGNALSIYARDPDGNKLELFIDLPWYVSQPMKRPVDMNVSDESLMQELHAHARRLLGFCSREEWRDRMARRMAEPA